MACSASASAGGKHSRVAAVAPTPRQSKAKMVLVIFSIRKGPGKLTIIWRDAAGDRALRSGRRRGRGGGGAAAAAAAAMEDAGDDEQRGEEAEHHHAEPVGELAAEHVLHSAAAEIAGADEHRCPQEGGDEIENEKALPGDAADAEGEGREIAYAIDETEAQDEPGVVALDPAQRRIDPRPPYRPERQ